VFASGRWSAATGEVFGRGGPEGQGEARSFRNVAVERIVLVQYQLDRGLVAYKEKQFGLFRGEDQMDHTTGSPSTMTASSLKSGPAESTSIFRSKVLV